MSSIPHIVILGAGPGGYVAAIRAAQLGLKTAVVEKDNLGGICLNWGCIPTKALLKNAEHAWIARNEAAEWGMEYDNLRFDLGRVVQRSRDVSARIVKGVEFLMKKNKVDVLRGRGRMTAKGRELALCAATNHASTLARPRALSRHRVPQATLSAAGG